VSYINLAYKLYKGIIDRLGDGAALFDGMGRLVQSKDKHSQYFDVPKSSIAIRFTFKKIIRTIYDAGFYAYEFVDVDLWIKERVAISEAGAKTLK